jgi:hypothetical protein
MNSQDWVLVIKDDKDRFEIKGDKQYIDGLEVKVHSLKDLHKLSVSQVLKKINYKVE